MTRARLIITSLSLVFGGCSSPSMEAKEEERIFLATIRYLRAHPLENGYSPCREERMLKQDAPPSHLIKTDDVYGLKRNGSWKIMARCSDDRSSNQGKEIRYSFSRPLIMPGSATIEVNYYCGSLCGRGSIYHLKREKGDLDWHVTDVRVIWIG